MENTFRQKHFIFGAMMLSYAMIYHIELTLREIILNFIQV